MCHSDTDNMKKHAFSMEINMCQKGWWWSTSKDCSTVFHIMTWMQLKFVDLCESATLNLSQNITWACNVISVYQAIYHMYLWFCDLYIITKFVIYICIYFPPWAVCCLLSTYSFPDYCFYFKIIGPLLCLIYLKMGCFIIWLIFHKL